MHWENLQESKCPQCNAALHNLGTMWKCTSPEDCGFSIRIRKMEDLLKGKDSAAYKKKLAHFEALSKRKAANKQQRLESIAIQKRERLANLNRMLARGEISQEEYGKKTGL